MCCCPISVSSSVGLMNAAKPERADTIQMLTLHEGSSCWGAVTGMKLSQCAAYPTCSESVRASCFRL